MSFFWLNAEHQNMSLTATTTIHARHLLGRMLVLEPSFTASPPFAFQIVHQAVQMGIFTEILDLGGTFAQYASSFPDAISLRHDELPENLADAGSRDRKLYSETFWRALSQFRPLRPETLSAGMYVFERISTQPGEPFPSLEELERMFFALASAMLIPNSRPLPEHCTR
jgi:hypothetical protein